MPKLYGPDTEQMPEYLLLVTVLVPVALQVVVETSQVPGLLKLGFPSGIVFLHATIHIPWNPLVMIHHA